MTINDNNPPSSYQYSFNFDTSQDSGVVYSTFNGDPSTLFSNSHSTKCTCNQLWSSVIPPEPCPMHSGQHGSRSNPQDFQPDLFKSPVETVLMGRIELLEAENKTLKAKLKKLERTEALDELRRLEEELR